MKIADCGDACAWEEFVELYEPAVYRLARQRGLQHADAEEVVQDSLLAVSRAVETWVPDPARGRFRDWLFLIARNLIVNYLTRRKHKGWSSGSTDILRLLEATPDTEATLVQSFDIEYQREVLGLAAARVRRDVKEKTWNAFWMCAVKDLPALEVAQRLEMSIGSVYIARSRVMARLSKEARRIQGNESV